MSGAGLKLDLLRTVQRLDLDLSTKNGLGDGDLLLAVDIGAVAREEVVVKDVDLNDQVAGLAVKRLVATALDFEQRAVFNGLRYGHTELD